MLCLLTLTLRLTLQNFKHIMKELQGAIIIASAFQTILGYSGLMTVLLRYIDFFIVTALCVCNLRMY